MNTQMPFVAAEQFVRPLADQRNFHILPCPLGNEVHRNNGRCRDRLLQTFHDFRQRSFELGLVKLYRHMPGAQKSRRFRGIRQLVIFEALSVTYRVGWPGPPCSFINARSKPESSPPLRRIPTGTSLSRWRFTAPRYNSRSSSAASFSSFRT